MCPAAPPPPMQTAANIFADVLRAVLITDIEQKFEKHNQKPFNTIPTLALYAYPDTRNHRLKLQK